MWFKAHDKFHSSKKLMSIPKRARFGAAGLWIIAGTWSGDQLTDGFIPDYMIDQWLPPPSATKALVDAGLWERVQDGYQFTKWSEYQPSKADVEAERARTRERQQQWRDRQKSKDPNPNP